MRDHTCPDGEISMFFHILYIHLFRPFLKYNEKTSPLPAHVSPRKICTFAATMISKMLRLYRRSHGLRQICNIVVYIVHSACAIHLLNLPEKNAQRDIVQGVMYLEEIAESWLCARRTLVILSVLATRWKVQIPAEAATVLARTSVKFGSYTRKYNSDLRSSVSPLSISTNSNPTTNSHTPNTMENDTPHVKTEPTHPAVNGSGNSNHSLDSIPPAGSQILMEPVMPFIPESAPQGPSAIQAQLGQMSQPIPTDLLSAASSNIATNYSGNSAPSVVWNGQEWWLRDQSHFASGFGNWDTLDTPQDSQWLHNLASNSGGNMEVDMVSAGIPRSETWVPTAPAAGYPHWNSF